MVGLLDLRDKATDHIADLVGQLDAALAERDRAASENARQLAQVAIKTGVVLAERGEEIAALTAERDRLAADLAEHRTQSVRDAALITEARAERDRLAAQVQRVRDLTVLGAPDDYESDDHMVSVAAIRTALGEPS